MAYGPAIRLPNMATVKAQADQNKMEIEDSGMASPTSILRGNSG